MSELGVGTSVDLVGGEQVKIVKELGRGGQGIVYLVKYRESELALKWYLKEPSEKFYSNLKKNIDKGAPTEAFLWPMLLTRQQYGSFGYVMKLRPPGYYELGDFLLAKITFTSINAMIAAALNICMGFEMLHKKGYSYQDLNDGNFFIDPQNGEVLICDNDNVVPNGENLGIMGKARYMAPEIVAGGMPDTYSDRFSLAVVLFLLFYCNHPFEGKKVVACPCMTEENERKLYGSEALFIYDKDNHDNLPVRGIHTNVISRWPAFPARLRDAFTGAFSQKQIQDPPKRMLESMWRTILITLRNELVICPHCNQETFADMIQPSTCMECGRAVQVSYYVETQYGRISLSPKKNLYLGHEKKPVAIVRRDKENPSLWALQNLSEKNWSVETSSGKIRNVAPTEIMPVKPGLKITFMQGEKGEICQ